MNIFKTEIELNNHVKPIIDKCNENKIRQIKYITLSKVIQR